MCRVSIIYVHVHVSLGLCNYSGMFRLDRYSFHPLQKIITDDEDVVTAMGGWEGQWANKIYPNVVLWSYNWDGM